MRTIRHSRNGLFLMEIIINVLFFSILFVISLQLFVRSYQISESATNLHEAVTATENAISIYQSVNRLSDMKTYYPNARLHKNQITLYYDSSYKPCRPNIASYQMELSPLLEQLTDRDKPGTLSHTRVRFMAADGTLIYEVTASDYHPLQIHKKGDR